MIAPGRRAQGELGGGHWPSSHSWPQGGKVRPWPPGLPVSIRRPFLSARGSRVCSPGWLRWERRTNEIHSELLLSPQPEPPSPAAAWAICRSTYQEQNANPHLRRCTAASSWVVLVCCAVICFSISRNLTGYLSSGAQCIFVVMCDVSSSSSVSFPFSSVCDRRHDSPSLLINPPLLIYRRA